MSQKRRTEGLSVNFVNRQAEGWKFGVGDCFCMQLDIRYEERMDTIANIAKKKILGRKLEPSEKIKRSVWTQGTPPAYSFDRGHMFHEVTESQEGIRRSIVIILARPDIGALRETQVVDESGVEATIVTETEEEGSGGGFVDYQVVGYKNGYLIANERNVVVKEQFSRTQAGFVELLRTGR